MSASKLFGKDILITSTTNASGTTNGSISTLGGMNVNQTMLVSGALTSTANSNTIGNIFTTGGNVGIGTTAPVQVLDVNGNLNITGNFYQNGSVYSGSTQWGSTGANIYFNTGNVGIGTLAPSSKLHIRDTGSVSLLIEADSDDINENDVPTLQFRQDAGAIGMDIGINNSNDSYIDINTGTNTSTGREFSIRDNNISRLHIDSNGDVGINTITPHAKLTLGTTSNLSLTSNAFDTGKIIFGSAISGAYNTSHRYYIQRGGIIDNMNHLIIHAPSEASSGGINFMTTNQVSRLFINSSSGNIGIGTTTPSYNLDVVGSGDFSTFVTTGALYSLNQTTTNIVATASTITNLNIPGTLTVVNITSTNLVETNITAGGIVVTSGSLNATFNSNTIGNIFTTGGNVGIGTTVPQSFSQLHIRSSNSNSGSYIALDATNGANGRLYAIGSTLSGNTANAGALEFFDLTSSVMRMIIGSTGNVGINTTAPSSRLHVVMGDATSAGSAALWDSTYSVFGQSSNTGGAVGIGYNSASGGCLVSLSPNIAWRPMTYRGANHQFVISGTVGTPPSMILNSSGNLGIATTAPANTLDVTGTGRITTSLTTGALYSTNQTTTNIVATNISSATLQATTGITSSNIRIQSSNPQLNIINTTLGNESSISFSTLSGALHYIGNNVGGCGVNNFGFYINGSTRMTLASSGNIGIGLTNPAFTLDVNGTIDASDYTGGNIRISGTMGSNVVEIGGNEVFRLSRPSGYKLIQTYQSEPLVFNILGNNVGIATTSPESKLHVNGGITLEGETVSYGLNTDTSSRTNTYIVFKPAGALDDWAYIRQVGGTNAYKLAIDIHDDRGSNESFCVRSVRSTDNPDTIWEKFTVIMDGQSAVEIRGNNAIQTDWPGGWDGGLATRDITCTSIYYSGLIQRSDIRKKENVQTYTKGLNEVIQLRPVTFNWKSEYYYNSDEEQYGFIAQEVEQIIPEIVAEDSQGYKNIKNAYIPLLVNSIKELKAELDSTRAELAAIKTHVGL